MNEKQPELLGIGRLLEEKGTPDPKDETIAALESSVQGLADKNLEERFIWIIIVAVLFDALVFQHMENWAAAFVIGILELIGIVILADRCGVSAVMPLIDRIAGALGKRGEKGGSSE